MASYDLNANVSEAWTAPTAIAANTAKATSESGSRSKMATNSTSGNIRANLPGNEDLASFAAQLSQDDVARNLLLLTMISGNIPFGNTIAGNMHPLFPSLLPIGLPHQRFSGIMPQNPNMAQLQQAISERGNGKVRRRPANRSRFERRSVSSTLSRPCVNDNTRTRHMNENNMASSVNSNIMQTYLLPANTIANVGTLPRNDLALSVGANSMFATKVRSRDHERNAHRDATALAPSVTTIPATRTVERPMSMSGQSFSKSPVKQRYLSPSMTAIRGETPPFKSTGVIKGKYSARTFKIPYTPSFNEAEAAATLLGMRHGQTTQERNVATPQTLANMTSTTTILTSISRNGVARATNPISRNNMRTTDHDSHGAVDLSTRTKPVNVPTVTNKRAHNQIATQRPNNRPSTWQCKPASTSDRSVANVDETRLILSRAAQDFTRGGHDTTSVVSQCGKYICAFDLPASAAKWTNDQSMAPVQSAMPDQSQCTPTTAQQHAFNYKKVICEKFSQCASPSTVTYAESSCEQNIVRPTDRSSKGDRLSNLSIVETCGKVVNRSKPESDIRSNRCISTVPGSGVANIANSEHRLATATSSRVAPRPTFVTSPQDSITIDKVDSQRLSCADHNSQNKGYMKVSSTVDGIHKLGNRHDVPSFHDLRQKSKNSSIGALENVKNKNCIVDTSHENSFKSSNLYRIRNSAFGGSNDSLHSNSVKEDSKVDMDSESSSCSSDSEESVDESDNELEKMIGLTEEKQAITTASPSNKSSPQRSRFILSQPKFKLSNCESNDDKLIDSETVTSSVKCHSNTDSLTKRLSPSDVSNKLAEDTNDAKSHQTEIPELKCDGTEHEGTFKYKFIKALSNPDSKEGLAVDGKYLRALLGDQATCFYHNNKKYVLKPYLKPKETMKSVEESNETLSPPKSARKTNYQDKLSHSPERQVHRKIEPRISVTAVKRSDSETKSQVKLSKKLKKSKRRSGEISKKRTSKPDIDTGRRLERSNMDEAKINLPHNKRRRRNHEIENLIYEGAGGKTPIPDLSLRDSDVFSNIKLRRREAAKRGIVQTKTPEEKRHESKTELCRKRIKTAAHNRAIANKNRKKSIESKLRKYGKKDRQMLIRKDESQNQSKSTTSRATCVRITAGFTKPQENESGHQSHNAQRQAGDAATLCDNNQNNICVVSLERKCKPTALTDAVLNCKTVDLYGDNTHDDESRECASHTSDSKISKFTAGKVHAGRTSKISKRSSSTETGDTENSHYRRASKRISNRKQSNNDRRSNEKKIDDDEISISSTNFETDSTRSDSPLRTSYRNANNTKSKKSHSQAAKLHRSVTKTRNNKHENKRCKFSLMSCFPTESALTLAAAFGDLQPSYSMKATAKGATSSRPEKWNVGESALGIKQQLQRDVWRNMTLDMFTNSEYSFLLRCQARLLLHIEHFTVSFSCYSHKSVLWSVQVCGF